MGYNNYESNRPKGRLLPNPKLKFLEQCREAMRFKQFSRRTEETYLQWIRRYILFHRKRALPRPTGAGPMRRGETPRPDPPPIAAQRGEGDRGSNSRPACAPLCLLRSFAARILMFPVCAPCQATSILGQNPVSASSERAARSWEPGCHPHSGPGD